MQHRSKAGWRKICGEDYYFRSKWEANYGRWLALQQECGMIDSWEHEPQTFWFEHIKRGCRSYLPDFKVISLDGKYSWHEVKGYYDGKSNTKIARFKRFYPQEKLFLIDKTWFEANSGKLKMVIAEWE